MKKCLLLLALAVAAVACDKEPDYDVRLYGYNYKYASTNDLLNDGKIENNIQFYGKMQSAAASGESAAASGGTFTDDKVYFELTSSNMSDGGKSILYMHATRFLAQMPGLEMRIKELPFSGTGKVAEATRDKATPEAKIQNVYREITDYPISELKVKIEDTVLTVSFVCNTPKNGDYLVTYTGRMIVSVK